MADQVKVKGVNVRPAEGGSKRTVYVEHGIWYENGKVYVAVGDGGIWHRDPGTKEYAFYRDILIAMGRWPVDT